jgi:hypothetical protein
MCVGIEDASVVVVDVLPVGLLLLASVSCKGSSYPSCWFLGFVFMMKNIFDVTGELVDG